MGGLIARISHVLNQWIQVIYDEKVFLILLSEWYNTISLTHA